MDDLSSKKGTLSRQNVMTEVRMRISVVNAIAYQQNNEFHLAFFTEEKLLQTSIGKGTVSLEGDRPNCRLLLLFRVLYNGKK